MVFLLDVRYVVGLPELPYPSFDLGQVDLLDRDRRFDEETDAVPGRAEGSAVAGEDPRLAVRMDADRSSIENGEERGVAIHDREFTTRALCDDHRRISVEERPVRRT